MQERQETLDGVIRFVGGVADDALYRLGDPYQRGPGSFGDLSGPLLR